MPYSVVLSAAFPCQKKVKSCSQREPVSARWVSCSAAITTSSLSSSLLITAIFRASLMSCRSIDRPVVIVLAFQHPTFSAGLFLVSLFLSGAWVLQSICQAFCSPKPHTHMPSKAGERGGGGITLYWSGTAQFKAGGSYPVRRDDLSHCQKWPLVLHSAPVEYWGLSPVTHFSCCHHFAAALKYPLQGTGPGKDDMEDKLLPTQRVPPSPHHI